MRQWEDLDIEVIKIATHGKYNREERKIANEIYDLQSKVSKMKRKMRELKKELKDKYGVTKSQLKEMRGKRQYNRKIDGW